MSAIASSMSASTVPMLEEIIFGENPMGDEGGRALTSMLADGRMPQLRTLDIRKCEIGDEGLRAIAEAISLQTTRALEKVIAKKNNLQALDKGEDGEPLVIQHALDSLGSARRDIQPNA